MKSEENEKIEIHIYVKILARTGERSYFYQIFMRRKQAIPLQGSELFYKAEKKYYQRLFELPRYVVSIWHFSAQKSIPMSTFVLTIYF